MDGAAPETAAIFPAGFAARLAFDDFEAMAAAPRAWDQHYTKLGPGPFRGRLEMAHTARLQLGAASWSCGIRGEGALPQGAWTFALVTGAAAPACLRGVPIPAGRLASAPDRAELDFLHPSGCELLCLSLAHAVLEEAAATFFGATWQDAVGHTPDLRLRDAPRLAEELDRLRGHLHAVGPKRLADPAFGRELERVAAEAVAGQLVAPQAREPAPATRRALARRAEDYLRANLHRAVSIAELCAAVGAPERTLHLACRERFGLPPIAFLRVLRLHGARRQLLEEGAATSVTHTATEWGFYHFGEFATQYRRLFGETPSGTLRRGRG